MVDASAPLLFFDSGVGGLSVLGPTHALLPNVPIVYAADSAWYPYGKRTETELAERIPDLLVKLSTEYAPRLIVIACNTASTIALDHARAALDISIVGTVPAIKPAALLSKSRVIGVLGTQATVRQPYIADLAAKFASDCTIVRHGSPELVQLAEDKLRGMPASIVDVRAAIAPMVEVGPEMDVVVLACTHFPLLADEITEAFPDIAQVDGAQGIARRVAHLTRGQPWPEVARPGVAVFTGPVPEGLRVSLTHFGLSEVKSFGVPVN